MKLDFYRRKFFPCPVLSTHGIFSLAEDIVFAVGRSFDARVSKFIRDDISTLLMRFGFADMRVSRTDQIRSY